MLPLVFFAWQNIADRGLTDQLNHVSRLVGEDPTTFCVELAKRAIGETPTVGHDLDEEPEDAKHLLRVVSLGLHEGDTLNGLAEECEVSWKALVLFNSETDEENKVAKLLPLRWSGPTMHNGRF